VNGQPRRDGNHDDDDGNYDDGNYDDGDAGTGAGYNSTHGKGGNNGNSTGHGHGPADDAAPTSAGTAPLKQ
jgi:hypothetical protein